MLQCYKIGELYTRKERKKRDKKVLSSCVIAQLKDEF